MLFWDEQWDHLAISKMWSPLSVLSLTFLDFFSSGSLMCHGEVRGSWKSRTVKIGWKGGGQGARTEILYTLFGASYMEQSLKLTG